MSKSCLESSNKGASLLREKNYVTALEIFNGMAGKCKSKDGVEAIAVGKAEALNGLKKYDEAIIASDQALKVSKQKSVKGFFQKAVAQHGLKQFDASKATFAKVLEFTEKNQDTKARASNYALMAYVNSYQLNTIDSGYYYIDKAIAMDPSNVNFYIQKGDLYMIEKKYDDAFIQYDKAVATGKTDLEMYEIRSNARMKMVQEKYGTTNAQELRSKMNTTEKEQLCTELKKALQLGWKDMKQDMFAALVCK